MSPLAKALRLWHTVRWLKPVQVYGRAWFRLSRPRPDLRPAPRLRALAGHWVEPARRSPSMVSATQLRFLGEERDLDAHGWDDTRLAKLWRYNQHYFDDLAALDAAERTAWHRALIARWMRECPAGEGTAWEPYPTSLRVVNWIKWLRAGNEPVEGMLDSLAAQVRFLTKRLEWHLLGNHLFVNAKALVIAGVFFEGDEAAAWRERGWRILRAEVPEQILADGGQFERSPMYHALAVEDMLDLANAMGAYPHICRAEDESLVTARIAGMLAFLRAVSHPDGEVAFFNDSATGVAPSLAELESYASKLVHGQASQAEHGQASHARGLPVHTRPVLALPDSGFVRVTHPSTVTAAAAVAILDVGPVGPDYLPGHAHADTLSFELSIGAHRVLVNSGTSLYGVGPERLRQRGTAAHNTVTVDGANSSEVWGGFRVARRASARLLDASTLPDGTITVTAEHDGYRGRAPGAGDHRREWRFAANATLTVNDLLPADGARESHWHFAPGFEPVVDATGRVLTASAHGITVRLAAEGAAWRVTRSTYHPRFGVSEPNWKAIARFEGQAASVRIEWQPCTSSSSPTTSPPK